MAWLWGDSSTSVPSVTSVSFVALNRKPDWTLLKLWPTSRLMRRNFIVCISMKVVSMISFVSVRLPWCRSWCSAIVRLVTISVFTVSSLVTKVSRIRVWSLH